MVNFTYSKNKDVWCLLNKGKASNNSAEPTKIYEQIVSTYGNDPSEDTISQFIDEYIKTNNIDTESYLRKYQQEWLTVASEYHKRTEKIFSTSLPGETRAYLTVNNRNPYNISENYFYVTFPKETIRLTVMHELWHFYTWYGLGIDQEKNLGKQKYNDLKESLTVLINIECADLLPKESVDKGYPQHEKARKEIETLWRDGQDIKSIWNTLIESEELFQKN